MKTRPQSGIETAFFRDAGPFQELRTAILPDLIERRAQTRRLSIWSAGCSSGQEPYSLALLLREEFPCLAVWDLTILGSDLSEEKLERARGGRYSQAEVNRGMPVSLLVKSFHRDGVHWTIDEPTRRSVRFATIDLADAWPSSGDFDLIALRNVLSDLDAETRRSTLSRLTRVIAPDGYLWLGSTEPLDDLDDHFERDLPEHGNFYRLRSSRITLPIDLALL